MADFDYESLVYSDRKAIHDALAETTVKHILAAQGLFEPMPFDTAASPSQMLETVHLPAAPTTFDEINALGTIAGGDFYNYAVDTLHKQPWFFNTMRALMEDGHHIFPVTPHGNIADIAFWQAGWIQEIGQDDWPERNADAISRGVTTIKAFDMAASEVVQKLGHVFLSFPRTPTIDALAESFKQQAVSGEAPPIDIDQLITTNNKNMRSEVKTWLSLGLAHRLGRRAVGKAFHSAWSGKTDKVLWGDDHRPTTIKLGKISNGTIDLVKHGLVLPVAIWYGEDPVLEVGELTKVTSEKDARRVQQWQAETLELKLGFPHGAVTLEAA